MKKQSNLVYFQQNTRLVVVITVAVFGDAVKVGVGRQLFDIEVTELLVRTVNCVVARTVRTAITCCPIPIDYNIQQISQHILTATYPYF